MNSATTNTAATTPIIIIVKSEPDDPGTTRKKIKQIPVTECYLSTDKMIDKYTNGICLICCPSKETYSYHLIMVECMELGNRP